MGIKNLNKFLKKNCPNVFEEIHISEYAFKKIAIDISLYLCKYKSICGDRWLSEFLNLVSCLRRNEIHCIFIYDNGAPPEKKEERKKRAESRHKMEEKIYMLSDALDEYYRTGEIDQCLIELYNKKKSSGTPKKRLLKNKQKKIDMNWIEWKIKKMKSYILNITEKDFQLTKDLFDILDVPWCMAPLEAETMCADLCKRGLVDAVLSEDTDVLAYKSPKFLTKITSSKETCVKIDYQNVLKELELNEKQFLDFCIMCGTDYNKNIFRVGPEKAYRLIKEHGSIEEIEKNTKLDTSVLKHKKSRELFTEYKKSDIKKIKYCGKPDFKKLKEFIFKHNININIEGIRKSFIREIVIIED
tara:strand:- start:551 stop:1621 length:1071 start_codon:yes stop_codon:yes gene_type:complete